MQEEYKKSTQSDCVLAIIPDTDLRRFEKLVESLCFGRRAGQVI
jgi:hypothetical protein